MSLVTVLCPNGRRQQVKVEANTKILNILEEVCKKQGYNSDEYDLIHLKRHLDVTLTFRLSGIPNNAQLELHKLDVPRKLSDVVIVLQFEDGKRLPQQIFKPDTKLYDVLETFKNAENSLATIPEIQIDAEEKIEPVCSYLNDEIIGKFQLENMQLKDLGLTGGRAIIRFNYRRISNEQMNKLNSEFKIKLEKKIQLESNYKLHHEQQNQELNTNVVTAELKTEPEKQIEEIPFESQQAAVKKQKYDDDAVKTQSSSLINTETQMEIDEAESAAFSDSTRLNNEFINFKFPESTKGLELNNINELAEIEKLSKQACAREAVVFNLETVSNEKRASASNEGEPDEFFEITVQDLRMMLTDLQRQSSIEDRPLMTKAMRELEQDKKAMKYDKVVIRIKFKNNYVLQGLFRPKEPVHRIYEFVKENIEFAENEDFYLYTAPPKEILSDKKKTLFEYHLCPAAIVHYGNNSGNVPNFKPDILTNLKSIEDANEIVAKNVHERIRNIEHEGINWMEKENEIAKRLINSSGLIDSIKDTNDNRSRENRNERDSRQMDDLVKQKYERFLKGLKR